MPRASTIVAVLALFANVSSVSAFTTSHSRWAGASVGARTATRSSDASVLAMVAGRGRSRPPGYKDPEPDNRSLGSKMFGDIITGVQNLAGVGEEKEAREVAEGAQVLEAGDAISAIDQRAIDGTITYEDFLLMGKTFNELNGNVKLPGSLDAKQIAETKAKFAKHEKIVSCMTKEELEDTAIMREDLADIENKLPRVQRLSKESGVSEKDVCLFVAEFEAMRQSTMRIAAGEDPDAVNADLEAGSGNRAARRNVKKAQRKADKKMGKN
eukprot:CAMPEP_0119500200 /NCGR_PEP_ID=MMETSP1344-20130328/22405_1 /TAXON_ID=236787 /ORGANISM="Florenciella parvula, Strain CCMP2471" /LENGTH=268 /DNA_ID=CAMNT_0007536261 /DNA_START=10 /DNA_END=816 /DNA_ORIENTATION=+